MTTRTRNNSREQADRGKAGVADVPVVRTPDGELHGIALARWVAARNKAARALEAFRFSAKRMPKADVQVDPTEEPV